MESMVNRELLSVYYKNKKIFITGHTGFKGAWLMALLHSLQADVKGYALSPAYQQGLYDNLKPLNIGESILADIRDKERLHAAIHDFKPDYIFHLAAQPLVRDSYAQPTETFDINVTGTASLLEAAHHLEHPCTIVVVTTDKVYQNKEQHILYREDDALGGYDPYSASKACAELVVNAFRSSFFNPGKVQQHHKGIASARAGNVIGGGDWSKDRIIPDIVRALQQEQRIEVRNPHAVRPWQHVLEPLTGYLLLGGLLKESPVRYSKAYNFGPLPDDHLTVKELVETAIASWGSGSWKDTSDPAQPHEAGLLKLAIERSIQELHWKPKLNASAAIGWTLDWYKQPADKQASFAFDQINAYLSL
jgi:CDP-glucose 4,6-dehydratase